MTLPSITSFRAQVRDVLAEPATAGRHVIVLGVDGIPFELAQRAWRGARVHEARSVFPTTSSTAWLSSLTGASVDEHGVPGVVFAVPEVTDALIDVYAYQGSLGEPPPDDLFSDAARAGYTPVAILGDLEDTHGTWRDWLVHRAQRVPGHRFFSGPDATSDPDALGARLEAAVARALATPPGPCLVWCFLDADRHIHRHGYDEALRAFLARIDAIADGWARDGAVVIAHSDHGLVPTRHDPAIAATLDRITARHGCAMGGAGRTRWLYAAPAIEARVRDELTRDLPASVRIEPADAWFAPGSLARRRVGSIVLVAEGEAFLAAEGVRFEHGSLTARELPVPIAVWRPC